ncbi:MAG: SDR family NAD(P)-dependent oxidoreductase [Proteobacteria bacterium]|nr:SDR family NAD(P)-dependent oxidoreductase [Pseudomonadota bacterium]
MKIFAEKIAIVTGAASGIGQGLAHELARRGARVVAADINGKGAEEVAGAIQAGGGQARAASLDVSNDSAVQKLVEETAREFGRIDYMFNNAGIGITGDVKDMNLADWRRVIEVNLWGVIHGVQAVYPLMIRQGHGHIVNTGSSSGLAPWPSVVPYTTTKQAVVGLSTSLRSEAETYGVRVSVACPGFINTQIFSSMKYVNIDREKAMRELPFWGMSPDKCARIILRGVEKNKAIIVVGWDAWLMWHNYRIFPGAYIWANRFIVKKVREQKSG